MNTNRKSGQVIIGAFILIVGSLALIDNLDIVDTHAILAFWPTVFIAFGALKFHQARINSQRVTGVLLMVFGLLFTLNTTGVMRFRDWWPALLIVGGAMTLWKGLRERRGEAAGICDPLDEPSEAPAPKGSLNAIAFMSGNRLRATAENLARGEATAIMGAIVLDLRQAAIDGEARLDIFALWGGIEITVPNDWVVVSNCVPILGGVEDKTIPPMEARKRLVLEGYVIMGGVEIKN